MEVSAWLSDRLRRSDSGPGVSGESGQIAAVPAGQGKMGAHERRDASVEDRTSAAANRELGARRAVLFLLWPPSLQAGTRKPSSVRVRARCFGPYRIRPWRTGAGGRNSRLAERTRTPEIEYGQRFDAVADKQREARARAALTARRHRTIHAPIGASTIARSRQGRPWPPALTPEQRHA
jgi:hypothetical protein